MLTKDKIDRINVLSHKSKTTGLSSIEKEEQQALREEYIQSVRSSLKGHLLNLKVVDEEGKDVTPKKLKQAKANRKKH
jgi:uncharacterized protein YnzC (UPF0291/DUF896 family)